MHSRVCMPIRPTNQVTNRQFPHAIPKTHRTLWPHTHTQIHTQTQGWAKARSWTSIYRSGCVRHTNRIYRLAQRTAQMVSQGREVRVHLTAKALRRHDDKAFQRSQKRQPVSRQIIVCLWYVLGVQLCMNAYFYMWVSPPLWKQNNWLGLPKKTEVYLHINYGRSKLPVFRIVLRCVYICVCTFMLQAEKRTPHAAGLLAKHGKGNTRNTARSNRTAA